MVSLHCRKRVILTLIVALVGLLGVVAGGVWFLNDPRVPLLIGEEGAEWIRYRERPQLTIRWREPRTTTFRYLFQVDGPVRQARLTVKAMRKGVVSLNGISLFSSPRDPKRWKEAFHVDLSRYLRTGDNVLIVEVENDTGPALLLAHARTLGIRTDERWEARSGEGGWLAALPVSHFMPLTVSRSFPRADRAFRDLLPILIPLFLMLWFAPSFLRYVGGRGWIGAVRSPAGVRWLVLLAWVLLGLNNVWKLPLGMGMDHEGHLEYIRHVAQYGRIPLATEGWQMFQAPLYYLLEGALYRLLIPLLNEETVIRCMKLFTLVCGAFQVEFAYRTLRLLYPGQHALQVLGTLVGGLLPMNLYLSQSLGNEPLAGGLTALIILYTIKLGVGGTVPARPQALMLGFLFGVAMLAKTSAVLIFPVALIHVIRSVKSHEAPLDLNAVVRFVLTVLGVAVLTGGWYYLRNHIEMGSFFIGGWDPQRGIVWWQDPGYRTIRQLYAFGEALFYPVYASLHGFGDALYASLWLDGFLSAYHRPPWNVPFMLASTWLSLVPSLAILIGGASAVAGRGDRRKEILRFASLSILVYLMAILYLFLTFPTLSSAKASYALGTTPCLALLAAAGCDILGRVWWLKPLLCPLFGCWAACVYLAYLL